MITVVCSKRPLCSLARMYYSSISSSFIYSSKPSVIHVANTRTCEVFKPSVSRSDVRHCHIVKESLMKKVFSAKSIAALAVESSSDKVKPYLKLMRIDRPIGSWLLFWPCGWSIAMAAPQGSLPDLSLLALFGTGAFIMRGAGCTINDMWDRDIDGRVARTRDRPLVSGAVTPFQALVFLGAQLSLGLAILLQLNLPSILLGASSLFLVLLYPLTKRFTHWPQLVLGCTFNWGALLGWSAVHADVDLSVCLPLYLGGVCWTVFYDTIYAHQDKADDLLVGIKSTALRFGSKTKLWLTGFGTTMISSLSLAGMQADMGVPYYLALALVSSHLTHQLWSLNIDDPSDCARKFLSNHHVGLILFLGILLGRFYDETKPKIKGEIVVANEAVA